jgi:hypothetical protein
MTTLHYTSGGSASEIAVAGFNLVDIQSVEQLDALPDGMMGLVWLGEGSGVTASFLAKVSQFIGHPKLFGFFLVDEPDPTGRWNTQATAADLMAESDWIHANLPGAKTFITMMDMGSSANPNFMNTYNPANTHIDYFGIDPYPVRSESTTVDYNMIDRAVAAAVAAGIPLSQIVPVFQAFGGGTYRNDTGGQYVVPTPAQLQIMFDHWQALVPNPAFDYAYAWGSQAGDTALENVLALQQAFLTHNLGTDLIMARSGGMAAMTPSWAMPATIQSTAATATTPCTAARAMTLLSAAPAMTALTAAQALTQSTTARRLLRSTLIFVWRPSRPQAASE